MEWLYVIVFFGAMFVDIVPFPFPPAFTLMIFMQIKYDLNIWDVIVLGVAGSVLGRLILTLYIPSLSKKFFTEDKIIDVHFLGDKMKDKVWKTQAFVLLYSLLPLPTTPLFIAGGMAGIKPYLIIPAFTVSKFTSDSILVLTGSYATRNTENLLNGIISWQSISGIIIATILIFAIVLIDWRTLLQQKKFRVKFNVWK